MAVAFEVLTAVGTKMAVLWVVAPCSLVEVYRNFEVGCLMVCSATTQKSAILVLCVFWTIDFFF
jgi:hypothetical protein